MRESVTYQASLVEGYEEGWEEGRMIEARRVLFILGCRRYGPLPGDTLAALDRLTRIEQLEQLVMRLLDAESWAELLAAELEH